MKRTNSLPLLSPVVISYATLQRLSLPITYKKRADFNREAILDLARDNSVEEIIFRLTLSIR